MHSHMYIFRSGLWGLPDFRRAALRFHEGGKHRGQNVKVELCCDSPWNPGIAGSMRFLMSATQPAFLLIPSV